MYQRPSDWHNNQGIIRQAKEQEMGVILMRPLTSRVFQRLMAGRRPPSPRISTPTRESALDVGRLLLDYLSRIRTWTWRWSKGAERAPASRALWT